MDFRDGFRWHSTPSKSHLRRNPRECHEYGEGRYSSAMYSPQRDHHRCFVDNPSRHKDFHSPARRRIQLQFQNHNPSTTTTCSSWMTKMHKDGKGISHRSHPSVQLRYKTELCRVFEEGGDCQFGKDCTFAHGFAELRAVSHHPKYKTDFCRSFHTGGFCLYGTRCHFIHNPDEAGGISPTGRYLINKRQMEMMSNMFDEETDTKPAINEAIMGNIRHLYAAQLAGGCFRPQDMNQVVANQAKIPPEFLNPNMQPVRPDTVQAAAAILQQLSILKPPLENADGNMSERNSSFSNTYDNLMDGSLDCSVVDTSMKGLDTSSWSNSSALSSPRKEMSWNGNSPSKHHAYSPSKHQVYSPIKHRTFLPDGNSPSKCQMFHPGEISPSKNQMFRHNGNSPSNRQVFLPNENSPSNQNVFLPNENTPSNHQVLLPNGNTPSNHQVFLPNGNTPSNHQVFLPNGIPPSKHQVPLPNRNSPEHQVLLPSASSPSKHQGFLPSEGEMAAHLSAAVAEAAIDNCK